MNCLLDSHLLLLRISAQKKRGCLRLAKASNSLFYLSELLWNKFMFYSTSFSIMAFKYSKKCAKSKKKLTILLSIRCIISSYFFWVKFNYLAFFIQKIEFFALSFYFIFSKIFLAKPAFSDSDANSIPFWKFFYASSKSPLKFTVWEVKILPAIEK